jgi:M6 family metalloprotease-like protein
MIKRMSWTRANAAALILATVLALGAAVGPAYAGPAAPVTTTFELPDGTTIELRLWGDEFAHGWETLDGYSVVQNPDTGYFEYAVLGEGGGLTASGVVVGAGDPPAAPHLRPTDEFIEQAREDMGVIPPGSEPHNSAPAWATGNVPVLVIMVQFPADAGDPDGAQPAVPCTFTAANMQSNLFGGGASGPGDMGDYYDEISYNAINLVGTVVGCFTVAHDKNDYDDGPRSAADLVTEAINLADATVNFANFDNDNDGNVDQVAIAYAGNGPDNGQYNGADPNVDNLWPHAASIPAVAVDGKSVSSYFVSPELLNSTTIRTIGVYAHEYGHKLGLPDLYDTDNSSEGIGHWGLMGTGSWTSTVPGFESGSAPSHMSPWSKWFLGWVTPNDLTGVNTTVDLTQVETSGEVIQLLANPGGGPDDWPSGAGEYFLVENRQQTLFDVGIDGCGILIWHMDESKNSNKNEGHTAGSHRLVDPEEADGLNHLDSQGINRGDAGDPFPGSSNNTLFTDTTTPHAKKYDNTNSDVRVEMVSTICGTDMTVNFGVMPTADADGPYSTPEGTDVTLDGTGSSHPTDAIVSWDWDLDNDGAFDDASGDTVAFDNVGQDGVFPIALRVTTDDGAVDVDQTTVTVTNVAPSVDLNTDAPENEGSPVNVSGTISDPGWLEILSGTIDWDDGSPLAPIVGVLENVRPDATLTFDMSHTYGDNGLYSVEVCGSDDDTTTCETIAVEIDNVPPAVSVTPVGPIDEGELADVTASFTDPGWLDTYTYEIDWGWVGFLPDAGVPSVTTEGPPEDIGEVTGSQKYGDNGAFTITVTVTDDDGGVGADSFELTVNNVIPTALIDESTAILINGVPTILAHAGEPVDFEGNSTDPGSDDLFLSWDWDDGAPAPDVTTDYLVNDPVPDPFPSPTDQPRDVTDMQTHAFEDACLYTVVFSALDDDGGTASDDIAVIIVGNADQVRSAGYWQHQFKGNGKIDFAEDELECYLAIVGFVSNVFDEETDASTLEKALDVLNVKGNKGDMQQIFDRQLLAAWLNFANGAIEYDELVDTDGDNVPDTAFAEALAAAETVRLDPGATKAEREAQKNMLDRLNNAGGG